MGGRYRRLPMAVLGTIGPRTRPSRRAGCRPVAARRLTWPYSDALWRVVASETTPGVTGGLASFTVIWAM